MVSKDSDGPQVILTRGIGEISSGVVNSHSLYSNMGSLDDQLLDALYNHWSGDSDNMTFQPYPIKIII